MNDTTYPPQRNVAGFVLQANPDIFDIDSYLSRQSFIYFTFTLFAEEAQVGMPVFIKRSGPEGGLIARGIIKELPKPRAEVTHPGLLGDDLWRDSSLHDGPSCGINIMEERLGTDEGMMARSVLEAIPELAGHPLVAVRLGTVFRLSEEQLAAIDREWGIETSTIPSLATDGLTEGGLVRRSHYCAERKRRIVDEKKRKFFREHGRLYCEACQTDFERMYGECWNQRAIEAHHVVPLDKMAEPVVTRVEDLVLLCSTCHALVHQSAEVEENLKSLREWFATRESRR